MAIDDKQRKKRQGFLGSSDMAAIMGFDPFRNKYDVFLEKTDKLIEIDENKVMKRGRYLEPAILNFAEDELGKLHREPERLEFFAPEFYLLSHPDAITYMPDIKRGVTSGEIIKFSPIEAKSQGAYSQEVWGDNGTDEVPDRVIIQCHVHMICTGAKICYVPVYLPYREFQMFHVKYDQVIAEEIKQIAKSFWENNVLKDKPPDDVVPALPVVKRIKREPKTIAQIDPDLWEDYLDAQTEEKTAKKQKELAQAALLAAIGTAEAGQCERGLVTYYEQSRSEYTVPAKTFRVLRIQPVKEEKK